MDQTSPSAMVRRLSLQNGKTDRAMTQANRSMPLVRSVVVFPSALDQMPTLRSFKVLRVLDLQGCDLSQGYGLQYLGSLFHLRYLSLKDTKIDQLPESVGSLQFLEILDIVNNRIGQLPKCITQLTRLLHLSVDPETRVSNGIGSLTSLEELSELRIDNELRDNVEALGLLAELRVLGTMLFTDKWTDKLMESLCKLLKIQTLSIYFAGLLGGLDAWVPPPQLRSLGAHWCWISVLPAWINNPSQFQDLAGISINVRELQQEDLEILGRLPALHTLLLQVDSRRLGIVRRRFVVGASLFPRLVWCTLWGFQWPVVFQQGAMPRLRDLDFDFHVPEVREVIGSDGGFNLSLGNLQSLQVIEVWVVQGDASKVEVQQAEAAVRHAAEIHPNRPNTFFKGPFVSVD